MDSICLGCKKNFKNERLLENFEQGKNDAIGEAFRLGETIETISTMPDQYFIPDVNLYCDNCLKDIEVVKDNAHKLLLKVSDRNLKTNKMLDHYSFLFWNQNIDSDNDKEKYTFLFSYIEECFSLSSETAVELNYLFDRFENHIVPNFNDFSYMFYFRNIILKSNSLIEKLTIFYSVAFKVVFREKKTQNKYDFLLKQLRKTTDFNNTKFSSVINQFRENGEAFKLENQRKISDHDLSYTNGAEIIAVLDKINITHKLISACYDLFEEMIVLSDDVYKNITIPKNYSIINFSNTSALPIHPLSCPEDIYNYAQRFGSLVNQFNKKFITDIIKRTKLILNDDIQRIFDILNRLHEISRSHIIVINLFTKSSTTNQNVGDIMIGSLFEKNYNSLINDMIYRIYSVNDKLARFLANKYQLITNRNYIYFDDLKNIISNQQNQHIVAERKYLFTEINKLLVSNEYLFLTENRNRIFHIRNDENTFNMHDEESFNYIRLNHIHNYYKYMDKIMTTIISDITIK